MNQLGIILPIVLLVLEFMLKLFIDRSTTLPVLIRSVLELPVDISFLATSFVVAFTILSPSNSEEGLVRFVIYLIGTVLVIFGWRRSVACFEQDRRWWSGGLAVASFALSATGLTLSIGLLMS